MLVGGMVISLGLACDLLDFPDGKSTTSGISRFLNSFLRRPQVQVGVES